jgi:hypothetical protein
MRWFLGWLLLVTMPMVVGCKNREGIIMQPTESTTKETLDIIKEETMKLPLMIADNLFFDIDITVAFANKEGDKLIIVFDNLWYNYQNKFVRDGFDRAIDRDGRILEVRFFEYQKGIVDSSARDTMYDFDYLAGEVYAVTNTPAIQNETYILFNSELLPKVDFLKAQQLENRTIPNDLKTRIKSETGKNICNIFEIARYNDDFSVYIVEYEGAKKEKTADIVVGKNMELFFCSYAVNPGDGAYKWPGGYSGRIYNEKIVSVICSFEYLGDVYIVIEWVAAEVMPEFILKLSQDSLCEIGIRSGRYIMPR